MTPPNIRVKIEDFRAVNNADIIINGITVVAGENGCGKSSLSKLLYFLYKTVANYDNLVKEKLIQDLGKVVRFFDITQQEIRLNYKDRNFKEDFRKEIYELRRELYKSEYLPDELINWIKIVDKLEANYKSSEELNLFDSELKDPRSIRYKFIVQDILKINDSKFELSASFSKIKELIQLNFKDAIDEIETRPASLFISRLNSVFSDGNLPTKFEVLEYDSRIFSLDKKDLAIPYNIQESIYIDSPMMLNINESNNKHWDDLNELLFFYNGNDKNEFTKLISNQIIKGDVEIEDSIDFKFKRSDGQIFNLLDVATGIKAFSIIQLLLKNNQLNDKTLLIIDEPESNLHPQWIIEYARIIVMLNKTIGVKFFLATHNPDMVSAIRYISEKENTLENVNFYLAEKSGQDFKYNYKHLDKEIDPIFESFNIAIERINKYGI